MRKALPGNATVTVCHSRTKDLPSITRQADVLIAAIGRANFVTGDMVKEGVTVIDVGINRVEDTTKKRGYRLVGDVEFEAVAPKSSHITPVPWRSRPDDSRDAHAQYSCAPSKLPKSHELPEPRPSRDQGKHPEARPEACNAQRR